MRSSAVASPNSIRLSPRTPTKNLEDFVGSKRENIIKKLTKDSPESLESPYNSTSQRPSLASKLSQPVGDKQRNPAFYHRKDRSRVKGENLPFLVASGRETTSSRGSDNTLLPQKRTNKQASSTKRVARPAGTEDKAVPATHPGQNNAVTSLSRPVRTQDFSDAIPNLQDETPSTSYGFPRRPISSEWPAYNEASVHATQQPSHGNNTTLTGDIYENSIMETVEDNLWTSRVEPGYKRAGSSPSSICKLVWHNVYIVINTLRSLSFVWYWVLWARWIHSKCASHYSTLDAASRCNGTTLCGKPAYGITVLSRYSFQLCCFTPTGYMVLIPAPKHDHDESTTVQHVAAIQLL